MAADEIPQAEDTATKFLFDLSFDEDLGAEPDTDTEQDAEPDIPPPPPEPTFSEAELNAARAEAFNEGQAAGLNEAGAGIEQRAAAALETIATKIAALGEQQEAANQQTLKDLIALNRRILEMLLPAYVERHGIEEIDVLVSDCLTRVLDPGQIIVEVPVDSAEELEGRLRDSATRVGFTGALEIRAAPELGAGDVRLSWQNGGATRLTDAIWNEILEAVSRALHSLEPTAEPMPAPAEETPAEATAAPDEAASHHGAEETAPPPDDDTVHPDAASPDAPTELGTG